MKRKAQCSHEHSTNDPVVKRRRQRSMSEEGDPSTHAALREQRNSANIQHDAASQRENDKLNDNEGSDLVMRK